MNNKDKQNKKDSNTKALEIKYNVQLNKPVKYNIELKKPEQTYIPKNIRRVA